MNKIRGLILAAVFVFGLAITGFGQQTECQQAPESCVLITRQAAIKALQDSDENKALRAENAVLKQAIADHKEQVETPLKIELAKITGEKTGLEKNAVQDRAIISVLLANTKKKCVLSICF